MLTASNVFFILIPQKTAKHMCIEVAEPLAPVLRELSCALSISRNVKRSNIYNAKRGLMFKSWTLTWTDLVMFNRSIQNH